MKNIFQKRSAEYYIIIAFSIMLYLSTWITTIMKSYDFIVSSLVVIVFWAIISAFYVHRLFLKKIYSLRLVDYILLVIMLLDVISFIFAVDKSVALSGTPYRYEGIFALFLYYAVFYMSSHLEDESEKRLAFCFITGILVFSSVVGVLSGVGLLDFVSKPKNSHVAAIPFSNQNFFGIVSGMAFAVALGMILAGDDKRIKRTGIVFYVVSVMAMFSCDSMGPLVGNIMAFVIVFFMQIIVCVKKNDMLYTRKIIIELLLLVAGYLAVMYITDIIRGGFFYLELSKDYDRLSEGLFSDRAFTGRMSYWKAAFRELPNYWLTGTGIDNFALIGEKQGLNSEYYYVDKAHNEYIQIMLTEGVFSVVAYITFLFVLFIKGLKEWYNNVLSGKWMYLGAFILFFSYIAQAFFNVRLIYIAPYFFIMCGILYSSPQNG